MRSGSFQKTPRRPGTTAELKQEAPRLSRRPAPGLHDSSRPARGGPNNPSFARPCRSADNEPMTAAAPPIAAVPARLEARDLGLYGITVFVWGTSWIAMKGQLGEVAPEVSTLWRFAIAAPLMWLWAAARGERLRYRAADHLRFAATGAFMFSCNLLLFLYAALYLPSGLLAVVFSLVSIL